MKLFVCIMLLFATFTSCGEINYPSSVVMKTNTRPQVVQSSSNVQPQVEAAASSVKVVAVQPKADCEQSSEAVSVESSNNVPSSVEVAQPAAETESASASSSGETTTTTVTTTYVPDSSVPFTEVSTSLVNTDTIVEQLLTFGAKHIVSVANQKQPLSDLSFTVSKVNHLYTKTIGDEIHYKFDVQLTNSKGDIINTVFCDEYSKSTGQIKMISYQWKLIHNIPQTEQTETITKTETVVTHVESPAPVVESSNVIKQEAVQAAPVVESSNVIKQEAVQAVPEVESVVVVEHACAPEVEASKSVEVINVEKTESVVVVEAVDVPFTEVSTSLVGSDSLVTQLLIFGADHIVTVVNAKHPLSNLSFTVSKVNHVYVKTIGDYVHYKFDVELSNSQGYVIDTVFCVQYCKTTGQMKWVSYKWNLLAPQSEQTETVTKTETVVTQVESPAQVVESPSVQEQVVQVAPETESVAIVEQVSEAAPAPETQTVVVEQQSQPAPVVEACDTENAKPAEQSSQSESTTTTTTTTTYVPNSDGGAPTEAGYVAVSTSLINSDALVGKLLSYGATHVIEVADANNTITDLNFHVSKSYSLYKQVIGNRVYYKFDIQLQNSEGVTIETTFVVKYCTDVQTLHWMSYKYQIYYPVQAQPSSSSSSSNTETVTTTTTIAPASSQNVETSKLVVPSSSSSSNAEDCGKSL